MSVKPIIFSGAMVRAILARRKTQTRRLRASKEAPFFGQTIQTMEPKYERGDLLWVRESIFIDDAGDGSGSGLPFAWHVKYLADKTETWCYSDEAKLRRLGSKPAIHMSRWASRITLEVNASRIERLQEITADDIVGEGAKEPFSQNTAAIPGPAARDAWEEKAFYAWTDLWNSINGKRAGAAWDDDPVVEVISFTVHLKNIDQLIKERAPA